jgi:hypothetical protein
MRPSQGILTLLLVVQVLEAKRSSPQYDNLDPEDVPLVGQTVGSLGDVSEHSRINYIGEDEENNDNPCKWGPQDLKQMALQSQGKCANMGAKLGTQKCPLFIAARTRDGNRQMLKIWERKDTRGLSSSEDIAKYGTKIYLQHPCASSSIWIDEVQPNMLYDGSKLDNQIIFRGYSGVWRLIEYDGTWRKIPEDVASDVDIISALPMPRTYAALPAGSGG